MYLKKYDVELGGFKIGQDDHDWTGAEIESCCMTAWEEMITVKEASSSIIPVAVSGAKDVERLRCEANGRYSSVNHPGPYKLVEDLKVEKPDSSRRLRTRE